MRLNIIVLFAVIALTFASCSKNDDSKQAGINPNAHKVTIEEVQQVNSYSYLRVKEAGKEYWMAVTRGEFKAGQVWYYENGMEMKNFESKELNKKFDSIFFVDALSAEPPAAKGTEITQKVAPQKPVIQKENVSVEPAAGGVTIADLFSKSASYAGKKVFVKGKVIKINTGIMKRNWVHIQDGTSSGNDFDLTVTTAESVGLGDVVTFQGTVLLNQDFGFGYTYKILLSDAKLQ